MPRLSLRTKLELIEYHEKENASLLQTAKKFGTTITTVHKTLKNKCSWVKLYNSVKDGRCKKFSFSENAVVDSELAKWYSEIKSSYNFEGITRLELRKRLNKIVKEHKIGFKVSRGWINEFVRKYAVILKKVDINLVKKPAVIKHGAEKGTKTENNLSSDLVASAKEGTLKTNSVKGKIVKPTTNTRTKTANIAKSPPKRHKVKFQVSSTLFGKKEKVGGKVSSKQGNIRMKHSLKQNISCSRVKSDPEKLQKATRVPRIKQNIDTSESNKNEGISQVDLSRTEVVETSSLTQNSDDDRKLLLEALKIRRRTSLDKIPVENSQNTETPVTGKDVKGNKVLESDSKKKKSPKTRQKSNSFNEIVTENLNKKRKSFAINTDVQKGDDSDKPLESESALPKKVMRENNTYDGDSKPLKTKKISSETVEDYTGNNPVKKNSQKIRRKINLPDRIAPEDLKSNRDSTTKKPLKDCSENGMEILTSLKIRRKSGLANNNDKGDADKSKVSKSPKILRKSSSSDKIVHKNLRSNKNLSKINIGDLTTIKTNSLNKKSRKRFHPKKIEAEKTVDKNLNETFPTKTLQKLEEIENRLQETKDEEVLLENNTDNIEKKNLDKIECQVSEEMPENVNKIINKMDETECDNSEQTQKFLENNKFVEAEGSEEREATNKLDKSELGNSIKKSLRRRKTRKALFYTGKRYRRFTRSSTKNIGNRDLINRLGTTKSSRKKPKRSFRKIGTKLNNITCDVGENDKRMSTEETNLKSLQSSEIPQHYNTGIIKDSVQSLDSSSEKNVKINHDRTPSKTDENHDQNSKMKIKTCYSQASNMAEPKVGTKRKHDVFEFNYDEENEPVHNIPSKRQKRISDDLTVHTAEDSSVTSRITRGNSENFVIQELLPVKRRRRKSRKQPKEPDGNTVKLEKFIDPIVMSTPLHHEINLSLNKIGFEENIISHTYMESAKVNKNKVHKTSKKRSLRIKPAINSTTDDDDEQRIAETPKLRRTRRRRRKTPEDSTESLIIKTEPIEALEQFHDTYYETIENDNVVEIVCNRNSAESSDEESQKSTPQKPKKSKIEILSDIKIISGSKNLLTKKTRSKSESAGTRNEANEHVFKVPASRKNSLPETPSTNFDVSWSNLFPDLDKTVSAEELVNQINEIEFQYDPDAFKNVKIEVLSSGCTDEDENNSLECDDGAEGDDEFEDDDVPSSQGQSMPPPNQLPQPPPNSMQGGYRPPMPPNGRAPAPRGPQPGPNRMPGGPRPPMNNRAPGVRPRAPMIRPRGAAGPQPIRGQLRPRLSGPQNGVRPGHQTSPIKRTPDQNNAASLQKRKKVDVLAPSDKDDDDCQVICMQPKSTGLPQIESVQGASESVENSIMKLSDSITLSVRNPPPKAAASPQKSDAKAVANVLASRGITVTASGKPKESPTKQAMPTALSLNGAVSIVAASKNSAKPTSSETLPTVDLTDDTTPPSQNTPNRNRPGLPYRCDLCPAQYPNAMGLNKHRQAYHKTTSGMCELGVPLINLKQPGIMQKLTQLGINNYIPLPSAGSEGTYALPIITTKNPGNVSALGASQMLSLGPVRAIPRPGAANNANNAIKK